ncbi:MAG: hypothetical protein JXO49_12595 [Deltaproteobacteria bacterium]|nr:hypothetical protein [Candidatus Anaeroferrophillus wilburensis]MBN2890167.1 hypothetical protein [Deltaproteobacteria bacterium]
MIADQMEAEKSLFVFLRSVCDGTPGAGRPLLLSPQVMNELLVNPHPELAVMVHYCLDELLLDIEPDAGRRGLLQPAVPVVAFAIAAHNCLAAAEGPEQESTHLFTGALVESLPPARTLDSMLACHGVLRGLAAKIDVLGERPQQLVQDLLERSPLTALTALDSHTPVVLDSPARELLPGWQRPVRQCREPWADLSSWLDAVGLLLLDERLCRWLRHSWLSMPETRLACRNLGLVLAALHHKGGFQQQILEFYEAYDYFGRLLSERQEDGGSCWPVLQVIRKLLLAAGEGAGAAQAVHLNRRGNEYFLKFRPLIDIIIAEGGIPAGYGRLSREFVQEHLRPLLDYVAERSGERFSFGTLSFASQ